MEILFKKRVANPAGTTWFGMVAGHASSFVSLTQTEDALALHISTPDANIRLQAGGSGDYWLSTTPPRTGPTCGTAPQLGRPAMPAVDVDGKPQYGSGRGVDLVLVVTTKAVQSVGGAAVMDAVILNAINTANELHSDSNTSTNVRLVQWLQEDYVSDGLDLDTMLDRFASHARTSQIRNQYGADLMSIIASHDDGSIHGWGRVLRTVNGHAESAFSSCWVGSLETTLVHELGHNMGCTHSLKDLDNGAIPTGLFPYSHAHYWEYEFEFLGTGCTKKTGTIMSNTGHRIFRFSNPSQGYELDSCFLGDPRTKRETLGSATLSDNSRTIRQSAVWISAYRTRHQFLGPLAPTQVPLGTARRPWNFPGLAFAFAGTNDIVSVMPGNYAVTTDLKVTKPLRLEAWNGPATIGKP